MKLGRFLTTLGIGALVGMLLAPKKGSFAVRALRQ